MDNHQLLKNKIGRPRSSSFNDYLSKCITSSPATMRKKSNKYSCATTGTIPNNQYGLFSILNTLPSKNQVLFITSLPDEEGGLSDYIQEIANTEFIIQDSEKTFIAWNLIENVVRSRAKKSTSFFEKFYTLQQQTMAYDTLHQNFNKACKTLEVYQENREQISLLLKTLGKSLHNVEIENSYLLTILEQELPHIYKEIEQKKEIKKLQKSNKKLTKKTTQLEQEKTLLNQQLGETQKNLEQKNIALATMFTKQQTCLIGLGCATLTLGFQWLFHHFFR
ncbi:MAG: hypothetical protein AB7E68_04880 [Candidatus Babeliales bacterium]